jgi:hypothetical protein
LIKDQLTHYLYSKLIVLSFVTFLCCIEPYQSPEIPTSVSPLVIDGYLNLKGTSSITLSRAQSLSSNGSPSKEFDADVRIEDEDGNSLILYDQTVSGVYSAETSQLNPAKSYRLRIKTNAGGEYLSDFQQAYISQPIDSITWKEQDEGGVKICVNSNDESGNSRYYLWTYTESWKYSSAFYSLLVLEDGIVKSRVNNIYDCFQVEIPSKDIVITTTQGLSEDRVQDFKIKSIIKTDERLSRKYSIDLRQRVISKEAYNYFLQLQRNTQSTGTLFDPLPSDLTGNIRSVNNPNENVLGFFYAGSESSGRLFISSDKLKLRPSRYLSDFSNCSLQEIPVANVTNLSDQNLLVGVIVEGFVTTAYTYSSASCVDCRSAGGTITKPDFWED